MNNAEVAKKISLRKLIEEIGWDKVKEHAVNSIVQKRATLRYTETRHQPGGPESFDELRKLRHECFAEVRKELIESFGKEEI